MKASTTDNNGHRASGFHTSIDKAITWLRDYAHAHPYSAGAEEARKIVNELRTIRNRPGLDELLALLGQIAKTDQGLQEIHRAKTQINESNKDLALAHEIENIPKVGRARIAL